MFSNVIKATRGLNENCSNIVCPTEHFWFCNSFTNNSIASNQSECTPRRRSREKERSRESEEYGGIASNSQKPLDEAFGLCFDFNSEFLYFNNNNPSFVISLNDLSKCLNVLFIKQKKLSWVNIPFAFYKAFLIISVEPFKLQAKS